MESDDDCDDQTHYRTPMLTPHTSERNTTRYEHTLDNFTNELEESLNNMNYPGNNSDCESEDESDAQAQQPSEAADAGTHPNEVHTDPVDKTIDIAFEPQPSQDRDDICSPTQDAESSDATFFAVVPDLDIICDIKPSDSSNLVCTESLCVPYTDEPDEISVLKQTLTTTTITTEYTEIKKNKNDIGHIMISYNHSTKVMCSRIAKELKNMNYHVWIDQDNISGDVLTSMASAVENAFVVLMAVNEQYYQSRYCRLEAEYSVERNKASIPMLMQRGYKAAGWLGIINGSKLFIDFSKLQFDEAFNLLIREIEAVRISLGAEDMTQTSVMTMNSQSMTTMGGGSRNHYQNVHDWHAEDVLEWLNREKLEVFENVLNGFTGSTLWQLYKIRFDSAPDYYRTIESLLPPNLPLRLFYNLTFNAALEVLFSSSSSPSHGLHR